MLNKHEYNSKIFALLKCRTSFLIHENVKILKKFIYLQYHWLLKEIFHDIQNSKVKFSIHTVVNKIRFFFHFIHSKFREKRKRKGKIYFSPIPHKI